MNKPAVMASIVLYSIVSVVWLIFAVFFIAERFMIDNTQFNKFEYDAAVERFPYGIIMLVLWIVSFVLLHIFMNKAKKYKKI